MARIENNGLVQGASGAFSKQFVFRTRGGKTFISKYPDMKKVKPSKKQLAEKSKFADAVFYAQQIINDPAKKTAYQKKIKKGSSVYHAAIKEFMKKK
jgi:hypothetical protein